MSLFLQASGWAMEDCYVIVPFLYVAATLRMVFSLLFNTYLYPL